MGLRASDSYRRKTQHINEKNNLLGAMRQHTQISGWIFLNSMFMLRKFNVNTIQSHFGFAQDNVVPSGVEEPNSMDRKFKIVAAT